MRAAVCREYGVPEVVRVEEVPSPPLQPDHVKIRVHAAAVNFPDILLVANTYQTTIPTPFIPGSEFAGVVEAVSDGVSHVAAGDRVFGAGILIGAFGEQVVVAGHAVHRVPEGVDDRVAAAFGVGHRTAYHVLRSVARVRRGDELVVLGAGGGVGLATVQLGALLGASVTAIASTEQKLDVAASYGASNLIDTRRVNLRKALREILPNGADIVVDPVGGDLSEPALRALRWGGRFVTVGYASGAIPRIPLNLVLLKGISIHGIELHHFATNAPKEAARDQQELMQLLASGRVIPHIGAVYALDEVAAAMRRVADRSAIGKVVLDITP